MPRPKQFDPATALDRAMQLFWERGYEATSIQDLVQALGINRFSLYDSFGDKRALYLMALDHYTERVFVRSIDELEQGELGLGSIEQYFEVLARAAAGPLGKRGCLLVNAATGVTPHDAAATTRLERAYARIERAFAAALARAQVRGELRPEVDQHAAARALVLIAQGSLASVRALRDPRWVQDAAKFALDSLRTNTPPVKTPAATRRKAKRRSP